jgi:hypothetical protein
MTPGTAWSPKNGSTTLESYKYDALNHRIVQNPGTATDLYSLPLALLANEEIACRQTPQAG